MRIMEFGNPESKVLLLIHGFQSPWQVWLPFIHQFEKEFRVMVPILPGHDPECSEDFINFPIAAAQIEEHCLQTCGGKIYAAFGMSMGGVLLSQLWQRKVLRFETLIFDGSPLLGFPPFLWKPFVKFYLDITRKSQKRHKKTLKQAVGNICTQEQLPLLLEVLDHMSDATIRRCLSGVFNATLPAEVPDPATQVQFFHGTAVNELYAKKAAIWMQKHYPRVGITVFRGKGHCAYSLLEPEHMLVHLNPILKGDAQ